MATSDSLPMQDRPVERFKPTSGHILGYLGLAVAAFTVVYSAVAVHSVVGLRIATGALFFAVVVWITQIRPRATAYRRHVVLKNSLRDAHVPLAHVDEVGMGQTLSLWAGGQRYVCIGIGQTLRADIKARRRKDPGLVGHSRYSELTVMADRASNEERASSYQTFVVTRLEELVEQAKREPAAGHEAPRHVWAWPEVVALAVTGLAFVVSLLL
jgi:hypothetical protein